MHEDDKWIILLMIVAIIAVIGLLVFTIVRDNHGMNVIERHTDSTHKVSN